MNRVIQILKQKYEITDVKHSKENQLFLSCKTEYLPDLLVYLRDYEGYTHFAFMTCVDRLEDNLFQLTYMLHNYTNNTDIGIRVFVDRTKPTMISVHHLWAQIATFQRELHEMFGIKFPGSPGVNDSFILEGWHDIPPMRRDFDTLKYTEETYFPRPGRETHDPKEYMKEKLYPNFPEK